jgi:hypothetical protein
LLHDTVATKVPEATTVAFLCECADEDCMGRVEVSPDQWEAATGPTNRFLIMAGHPRTEGEEIMDTLGPYEIVEKPDDLRPSSA